MPVVIPFSELLLPTSALSTQGQELQWKMAAGGEERHLRYGHPSCGDSIGMEECQQTRRWSQLSAMIGEEDVSRATRDHRALEVASHACAPNLVWREKVSQWCYDVVDHLGESRDVAYLAMSVLDRYCVVRSSSTRALDERDYEIAAMTALFLAVRVTGRASLELPQVMRMSRLGVRIPEILEIGTSMTESLSWERRLLTPHIFVRTIIDLLDFPTELNDSLTETATYLVEVSVCDAFFSGKHPFRIACAAVFNAIGIGAQSRVSSSISDKFFHQLSDLHNAKDEIDQLQVRLHHIYAQSEENRNASPHIIMDDTDAATIIVPPIPHGTVRVISSSSFRQLPNINNQTTIVPEADPKRVHPREESTSPSKRVRSS